MSGFDATTEHSEADHDDNDPERREADNQDEVERRQLARSSADRRR